MKKFEVTKFYGVDPTGEQPIYTWRDRPWLVLYGLAHIVDGLVILGSLTLIKTNLTHVVSFKLARLSYQREKKRLRKHSKIEAFLSGGCAFRNDVPDFKNPYYGVNDELEACWDDGWNQASRDAARKETKMCFDEESG